jgi:hypothetical protein
VVEGARLESEQARDQENTPTRIIVMRVNDLLSSDVR